jgi:unsaturated chondroitin disaccharide hydrolase
MPRGSLRQQVAINGSSQHSTWARAQAWAMLGFTQAAVRLPEFLATAVAVPDWWLEHVPEDLIRFWDFGDANIPDTVRDTSATAIAAAAAAMVKLAPLVGEQCREAAPRTVDALAGGHISERGALIDGCYNRIKHVAVSNELIWGDYFLLEATLSLHGHIDSANFLSKARPGHAPCESTGSSFRFQDRSSTGHRACGVRAAKQSPYVGGEAVCRRRRGRRDLV